MERFASFDGTSIAYAVSGGGDGDGGAVVLHHGFASTSEINWVRPGIVDALVKAGRRAVLIDARGHGESDHPHDPSAYGDGAMARDVRALLDHLGLRQVDIVGYSMGSFVALAVAAVEGRTRSLCLGGAGTGQVERDGEAAEAIARALEADDPSSVTDRSGRAFRSFADATGQDRIALAAIQRSGLPFDETAVRTIDVPTIVVNGDRDTLVGDPDSLARLMRRARSVRVPGDHLSAVVRPQFKDTVVSWVVQQGL